MLSHQEMCSRLSTKIGETSENMQTIIKYTNYKKSCMYQKDKNSMFIASEDYTHTSILTFGLINHLDQC